MSTISSPDRTAVRQGASLTPIIQEFYSIFLWDLQSSEILTDARLDPAQARTNAEYYFSVPPRAITMSEPFTTRVTATQNGGKFIESHGSIFKDIQIQGTTGLRPNKDTAPRSVALLNEETSNLQSTMLSTEVTGFDDIHFLRNIFRKYSDLRAIGSKVIMVWRNIKDDDYWIVEPKDFRLSLSSNSPLTYEYQIVFQGLNRFEPSLIPTNGASSSSTGPSATDPLAAQWGDRQLSSRMEDYRNTLSRAYVVVSTNSSRIVGAGFPSIELLANPIVGALRSITNFVSGVQSTALTLVRSATEGLINTGLAIETLLDTLEPMNIVGPVRSTLIRSLRRLRATFVRILAEPRFNDSLANDERQRRRRTIQRYRTPALSSRGGSQSPRTNGSPSFVGNAPAAESVSESRVGSGEGIRDLARRLLGDARRWHELVNLNGLRPPYTSDSPTRGSNVLGPGDFVVYPDSEGVDPLFLNLNRVSDQETEGDAGVVSLTYGRDLRLRTVTDVVGAEQTDLSVNSNGDLSSIVGTPNVSQAVKIKFATEAGSLPAHPYFGARYPIGKKASLGSFNTFRVHTLATLASDSRVSQINRLEFQAVGDILTVNAEVVLQNTRDYLSLNFDLSRV